MKKIIVILGLLIAFSSSAQVGYQVSLLNSSNGEPRANETVNVKVTITDNTGNIICEEQKSATTDGFGVLFLKVGNKTTFNNIDANSLPLKISASVDGILIGASDILSVPVAEYAKKTGTLTKEILCSKVWRPSVNYVVAFFKSNGTGYFRWAKEDGYSYDYFRYFINGDMVMFEEQDHDYKEGGIFFWNKDAQCFVGGSGSLYQIWR